MTRDDWYYSHYEDDIKLEGLSEIVYKEFAKEFQEYDKRMFEEMKLFEEMREKDEE